MENEKTSIIVYNWDGPMNIANLNNFIEFYNEKSTQNVKIDLYLTSDGGDSTVYNILKNMLESSNMEITLIAHTNISSYAFILFCFLKTEKKLLEHTTAEIHMISAHICERDVVSDSKGYRILKKELSVENKEMLSLVKKSNLSEKKKINYENGKDVYLSYQEVKSFMNSI